MERFSLCSDCSTKHFYVYLQNKLFLFLKSLVSNTLIETSAENLNVAKVTGRKGGKLFGGISVRWAGCHLRCDLLTAKSWITLEFFKTERINVVINPGGNEFIKINTPLNSVRRIYEDLHNIAEYWVICVNCVVNGLLLTLARHWTLAFFLFLFRPDHNSCIGTLSLSYIAREGRKKDKEQIFLSPWSQM